jgi:transcriptional regulator with XRE-family HTH domain
MEDKNILQIISKKMKLYRNKKGLSQEKLAEKSNLHRTYIGAVERAEKNLTIKSLSKIANALEIDIEMLFTQNEKE